MISSQFACIRMVRKLHPRIQTSCLTQYALKIMVKNIIFNSKRNVKKKTEAEIHGGLFLKEDLENVEKGSTSDAHKNQKYHH